MDDHAEVSVQIVGEAAHLFRLRAFRAAQAQRQSDHNLADVILRQHFSQSLQIVAFVPALDRVQPLSGDAQQVRDRHSDSFRREE